MELTCEECCDSYFEGEEHDKKCRFLVVNCRGEKYGCDYRNTRYQTILHQIYCTHSKLYLANEQIEELKVNLRKFEEMDSLKVSQIKQMQQKNKSIEEENKILRRKWNLEDQNFGDSKKEAKEGVNKELEEREDVHFPPENCGEKLEEDKREQVKREERMEQVKGEERMEQLKGGERKRVLKEKKEMIIQKCRFSFAFCDRIEEWKVPVDGKYLIKAGGASGGNYREVKGGKGALLTSIFSLQKNDTLEILVGQHKEILSGGGGSFVRFFLINF